MSVTYFSGNSATTINFGQPVYAPSVSTTYFSGNSATTINFGGRPIPTVPVVPYVAPISVGCEATRLRSPIPGLRPPALPFSAPVFTPRRPVFCFD